MTNGNDSATGFAWSSDQNGTSGLTKREYFAVHATEPLPSSFCEQFIRSKENVGGGKRKTEGNYYELLTPEERIIVRALWRARCADALIKALNETQQ